MFSSFSHSPPLFSLDKRKKNKLQTKISGHAVGNLNTNNNEREIKVKS